MNPTIPPPLNPATLPVEVKDLFIPDLNKLSTVLENGLKKTFAEVSVTVKTSPDLSQPPFGLAAQGICGHPNVPLGHPKILDVGGPPNLVPLVKRDKLYDLKSLPQLAQAAEDKPKFMIGAGAAPWTFLGRNAEMMPNLVVSGSNTIQKSKIARTFDDSNDYKLIALPEEETKMSLLGNLLLSEGEPGQVLEIKCKKRIGADNFVTAMRKVLMENYPKESIGMGGTFLIKSGKVKIHVMPDFSTCPLNSDEEVNEWLRFFEMSAPFVCLSVFVANDPGLDLRVEHSHGYSDHGDGGHYHYDTTPDDVEYLGYFTLGEKIYRIDRPDETHQMGRD